MICFQIQEQNFLIEKTAIFNLQNKPLIIKAGDSLTKNIN